MRAFRGFHPRLLMENHFVVVLSPIQIAENSSLNIFRKPDARQYKVADYFCGSAPPPKSPGNSERWYQNLIETETPPPVSNLW